MHRRSGSATFPVRWDKRVVVAYDLQGRLMPALAFFERLYLDLRYALRGLARSRVFTAIAILSLALGLGSAAAIFSLVDGVLIKPLPYRQPDRLVFVRE